MYTFSFFLDKKRNLPTGRQAKKSRQNDPDSYRDRRFARPAPRDQHTSKKSFHKQ
jgi:hypothetical protein